jgi:hypothetical protein
VNRSVSGGVDRKIAALLETAVNTQRLLHMYASAELANSEAYDGVVRMKHSLWFGILPALMKKHSGYDIEEDARIVSREWAERNRIMADNIAAIVRQLPGKRVVVCTGTEHRYMLRDLLSQKRGVEVKEFWEALPPP